MNASRARAKTLAAAAAVLSVALAVTACGATGPSAPDAGTAAQVEQPDIVTATAGDGTVVDLAPAATTVRPRQSKRPNILMIMADDMRVDDLRFMPTVRHQIKERGLEFKNSFSPFPLCCPARASFLTGMYAHNHHVMSHDPSYGFGAFNDARTLATALQKGGYQTGFVGKYLNQYGLATSRVTGGSSLRYVPAGWSDWQAAVQTNFRPRHKFSGGTYAYFKTPFNANGKLEDHRGEYQTTVIGQKTRTLINKYSKSRKPFFIYLSSIAPHQGASHEVDDPRPVLRDDGGYEAFKTPDRPKWVRGKFNNLIGRSPGMPKDGGPAEADVSDKPRYIAKRPEVNEAERRALVTLTRQRAETVYVLDQQIKKTIAKLKRTGEYKNTIIMFTSDNGFFLGEHRVRSGKVKPHEPSLRTPFLVAGPGVPQGRVRFDPMTTMDMTATIADYANVTRQMPYALDGTSKVRTIENGDRGWTDPIVTEALMHVIKAADAETKAQFDGDRQSIGIRTAHWKFVRYISGEAELYNLDVDPDEMTSLHDDPAYTRVKAELNGVWKRFKDCKGAACRASLPADLRAGPAELRASTLAQSAIHDAVYGW